MTLTTLALILAIGALVSSVRAFPPRRAPVDQRSETDRLAFDAELTRLERALSSGRWTDSGRWRILRQGPGFESKGPAFDSVRGVFLVYDTKTNHRDVVLLTPETTSIKNHLVWCGDYESLFFGVPRAASTSNSKDRSLATADRVFSTLTALLPRRLCNEEIGDALEDIHARQIAGRPAWQIHLKIASTVFWVILHAGIEFSVKVASAVRATTGSNKM